MSKYEALGQFLKSRRDEHVPMTFAEIERLIGKPLPPSAHKHRPWWSNNSANSALTRICLEAGYKSEQVDMAGRKLVFRRVEEMQKAPATTTQSALRVTIQQAPRLAVLFRPMR